MTDADRVAAQRARRAARRNAGRRTRGQVVTAETPVMPPPAANPNRGLDSPRMVNSEHVTNSAPPPPATPGTIAAALSRDQVDELYRIGRDR